MHRASAQCAADISVNLAFASPILIFTRIFPRASCCAAEDNSGNIRRRQRRDQDRGRLLARAHRRGQHESVRRANSSGDNFQSNPRLLKPTTCVCVCVCARACAPAFLRPTRFNGIPSRPLGPPQSSGAHTRAPRHAVGRLAAENQKISTLAHTGGCQAFRTPHRSASHAQSLNLTSPTSTF